MLQYVDASRLYHSVRGQAVIKLYVIFNVLEVSLLTSRVFFGAFFEIDR